MTLEQSVKLILDQTLSLNGHSRDWTERTPLLGAIPELDSMAVVNVLTAFENQLGIIVEDDEISADVFATLGDLTRFVQQKLDTLD